MKPGQTLVIINIFISALVVFSLALTGAVLSSEKAERQIDYNLIALNLAEAGIAKARWCLNQSSGTYCGGQFGANYSGENNVSVGDGVFTTAITTIDAQTKKIESIGFYPSSANPKSKQTISVLVKTSSEQAAFYYGVQVGQGGLQMKANTTVVGNIYSNGSIIGAGGARITGDAWVAGGTAILPDQQWTTQNSDFIFGKQSPQIDVAQSFTPSVSDVLTKVSVYIKKSGNPPDGNVKIVRDADGKPGKTVLATGTLNSSSVTGNYGWVDISLSIPLLIDSGIRYWIVIDAGEISNKYWTFGADAFDEYTGGTATYSPDWSADTPQWTATGVDFNFKTWMGGLATKIDTITVDGDAHANTINLTTADGSSWSKNLTLSTIGGNAESETINNSTIGGNARAVTIDRSTIGGNVYCQTITHSTVGGATYCPTSVISPLDPALQNMPVSEPQIALWKADAEAGGTINGSFTFEDETVSLGPKKITGDLILDNGQTLILTGTIYVMGNISISNNSGIALDERYGAYSGVIVNDGIIDLYNNTFFRGTQNGGVVMLLTTSPNLNESEPAIAIHNNAEGAVFYASRGLILAYNNVAIKQFTGYKITLDNNVTLTYEIGLANTNFSSGPAAGWSLVPGTWQKVKK